MRRWQLLVRERWKNPKKKFISRANNFSVLLLHVKNICWGFVNLETLKHFSTQLMDTWGLSGLRAFSPCQVMASGSHKPWAHGQITVFFTFSSNVGNFRLYNMQSSVRGILVFVVGEVKQLVQVTLSCWIYHTIWDLESTRSCWLLSLWRISASSIFMEIDLFSLLELPDLWAKSWSKNYSDLVRI